MKIRIPYSLLPYCYLSTSRDKEEKKKKKANRMKENVSGNYFI